MNLLLFSEENEYFTRLMKERLSARKNWRCLSVEDIRRRLFFTERISQQHSRDRRWNLDGVAIADGGLILDRVFSFGGQRQNSTNAFEMLSFLYYLRKSSSRHLCTLMHDDPVEWCLPLVSQWELVRAKLPELDVPTYVFPLRGGEERPGWVVTDYTNRMQWRPGRHTAEAAALAFARPAGKPVCVFATPNAHMECASRRAGEWAIRVCAALGLWFAEVLFFVDGERLTFGMVNVQPSKAFASGDLARFIDAQLKEMGA